MNLAVEHKNIPTSNVKVSFRKGKVSFRKGGWDYIVELKFTDKHGGFFHNLFCHVETVITKTSDPSDEGFWWNRIEVFTCGMEKHTTWRYRVKL